MSFIDVERCGDDVVHECRIVLVDLRQRSECSHGDTVSSRNKLSQPGSRLLSGQCVHRANLGRSAETASKSALSSTFEPRVSNPAPENPVRNRRTLIRRKIASSNLVFFDPKLRSFTVGQLDLSRGVGDS